MRIAYLSSAGIPSQTAHSLQVIKMCEAMIEEGHAVRLFAPRTSTSRVPEDADLSAFYGLEAPVLPSFVATPRLLGRKGLAAVMVRRVMREKFDLIYTRGVDFAFFSSRWGQSTALELHQMPSGRMGPLYFRGYLRSRPGNRLVVISSRLEQLVLEEYAGGDGIPILVAPDAVDLRKYDGLPNPAEARRQLGRPADQFTVGYFGSLYEGRGVELVAELARQMPDLSFLVGGGDEEQVGRFSRGESLVNVEWLRHVPHGKVPLWEAACEVLLMPYQTRVTVQGKSDTAETMSPLKLFEYMAAQRLILASDLPALREVLNDGNSALLPPDSPLAWRDMIRRAQRDGPWRDDLARRARLDVTPHTWRNRVRAILEPGRIWIDGQWYGLDPASVEQCAVRLHCAGANSIRQGQ